MATSMTWILTLVAIGVVIGVIKIGRTLRSPWWALGLGMILVVIVLAINAAAWGARVWSERQAG